ncbi:Hit1p [Sporobolomyces koalae]|uniref:Hit1p n=1 Tax=Sporobolomyces koalae TaxID=500713 RepID=UPI0031820A79
MQIRLPKPKDSEPRRKRPPIVSTADNPICAICNRQISRYHCPTCNMPYCSLACYKSPQHGDCSERFDRESLVNEIKSAEGKTTDEKKAMLEMLKRFEEENGELAEEDEGIELEREQLEEKLKGVDLDALPPEELLALLSAEQQAAFSSTLSDPTSINALILEELEHEQPWWLASEGSEDDEDEQDLRPSPVGQPPTPKVDDLPNLPLDDQNKPRASPTLFYNIVAVLLAYSYTLRTYSLTSFSALSPQSNERVPTAQLLAQLVPFLVEKSNTALTSLDGAVEYIASRDESFLTNPQLVALLLFDVAALLRPATVSEKQTGATADATLASHPLVNVLRALFDLHGLFATAATPVQPSLATLKPSLIARPATTTPVTKVQRSQASVAAHKTSFYAAFISHPRSPIEIRFAASVAHRAEQSATARETEAHAREEARRRHEQDVSRPNLLVEPRGISSLGIDRDVGEPNGTERSRIVEIIE